MAGPGETLESPWPPLAIRPFKNTPGLTNVWQEDADSRFLLFHYEMKIASSTDSQTDKEIREACIKMKFNNHYWIRK
jgi:hypothetical protein